jgi:hypothetical protein
VALWIKDKVAKNQEQLLQWTAWLNPGLHTEYWRALAKQPVPKGQRLILLTDRDSYDTIQRTRYKIFTGLSQRTVKVLNDAEVQYQKEAATDTVSLESSSEGRGDDAPTLSEQSRAD